MFYSRYTCFTFAKNSTSLRITYIFCNGIYNGLSFQINTLNLITCVLWSRVKGHR